MISTSWRFCWKEKDFDIGNILIVLMKSTASFKGVFVAKSFFVAEFHL